MGRVSPGALPKWIDSHKDHNGNDCLWWPFARVGNGYGQIMICGRAQYVHRLMCEYRNGPPLSSKHEAAHSCGNGHLGCVNPLHLSWKSRVQNMFDRRLHGTHVAGVRHGMAKFSDDIIKEVRRSNASVREIAEALGISKSHVRNIRKGIRRQEAHGVIP